MKLRDSFNSGDRFEGNRVLRWRSIPAQARIVRARAIVTPIDARLSGPFAEPLSFNGVSDNFGATQTSGVVRLPAPGISWVEIDFRARRTLASVVGTFTNASLQVDVGGGTYVEINKAGAFKTPSDPTDFRLTGGAVDLPALSVAKLKLTHETTTKPELQTVVVRSVPSNVSLRVGDLTPFWTHPGEMTLAENSPDFAAVLQAALATARTENGFYDLLFTIHSDTIARLQVDLEVEFLEQSDPLPEGLNEVAMSFDFSTLPQSAGATLNVAVPPNSRVVPSQTSARVRGAFAETRIARGPTGNVKPVAAIEVSPSLSQAQIIAFDQKDDGDIAAVAIDLLLESTSPSSRLRLDVREDLDGKPGDNSLLAAPVEVSIDQQAGQGARWTNLPLSSEFLFTRTSSTGTPQRYWLVLQSLVGTAAWSVDKAQGGTRETAEPKEPAGVIASSSKRPNIQSTRDGGLSWRDAIAMPGSVVDQTVAASGPFAAFVRLRTQPKTFKVPIELQAGTGQSEVRIKLDRFEPLGRVDFALDASLAQAINESLDKTPTAKGADAEHLQNGDFEQWQRVGDDLTLQPPEIEVAQRISALAFSPDGSRAYVLDQSVGKPGFLLIIDALCNREIKDQRITLTINDPRAFVISPDGTRAYIIESGELASSTQQLQVVDLVNNKVLGSPVDLRLETPHEKPAHDLALSPDGALLYIMTLDAITSSFSRIRVIDTATLEQQIAAGVTPVIAPVPPGVQTTGQPDSPRALAVSPDGGRLYFLISKSPASVVRILDTTTLTELPDELNAGPDASALSLSPDGKLAIVTNAGNQTVTIASTATGNASSVTVGTVPVGVAVSPDGTRAYALNKTAKSISIIDLDRLGVVDFPIPLPAAAESAKALALSPRGDQLYVASETDSSQSFVSYIQIGALLPSEWHLTSGVVRRACLEGPFHQVAVLGSTTKPTGLSQIVPVADSALYQFSFWGLARPSDANEPPAMAEVFWLGENCGPLLPNPTSIPIKTVDVPSASSAAKGGDSEVHLQLHRLRITAPAGARQAEVRFTVPTNGEAGIDEVSLFATSEAAANADFQLVNEGRLVGWTVQPAVSRLVVQAAPDGVQIRNSGAATAELVQTVPAKGGEDFTLEFQGSAKTASASQPPRVEIHWLKADGAVTGSLTTVDIVPDGLGSTIATEKAPDDAVQAEIHLVVPAGTTLDVKTVSLRFLTPTIVPVTFIAQAPGELTVSDLRVAFERVKPTAPPIPDGGLCIATPPGREPGETDDDCCCASCKSEVSEVSDASGIRSTLLMQSSVGEPIVMGMGSPIVSTSAPAGIPQGKVPQLTDIHGIAEARAGQLTNLGIDSVEKLALSTPETVAQIKFITLDMASRIVAEAKALMDAFVSN